LRDGRTMAETDDSRGNPVLWINQAASQLFFRDQSPLGQQIRYWGANRTIVGVVNNERIHGLVAAVPPAAYMPMAQGPSANGSYSLLIRAAGDPAALGPAVRRAVREQDPGLAVFGVEPLVETLSQTLGQRRFTMLVLGAFAGVALLLAVIGVHGVLSYAVTQRTREIGVRMALGADTGRVRRLIVGQGAWLAAGGLAIGVAGALAVTDVLGNLLYGVGATDPATFAAVAVVLGAVAILASYLPARRATKVDPMVALRSE
ncbi:MAG: FtsX-like permease family protein, partial [Sporichthyaceae bacterium]|nr:FtsX-like permease family protein [Sporichthyaceae bacterium]